MSRLHTPCLALGLIAALLPGCDAPEDADSVDERRPLPAGKADSPHQQVPAGSCLDDGVPLCGGEGTGWCYCDAACVDYGDCCSDYAAVCEEDPDPEPIGCTPGHIEITDDVLSGDIVWEHCEVRLTRHDSQILGSLTVRPGVHVVTFNEDDSAVRLRVKGGVSVEGTAEAPVVFEPGLSDGWRGLHLVATPDKSVSIRYAEIHKATTAISVSRPGNSDDVAMTVEHATLEGAGIGTGLALEANATIDDVLVRGFDVGIATTSEGDASRLITVTNSVIAGNHRGFRNGHEHDHCMGPEVAKPKSRVEIRNSDFVDNDLAFVNGFDMRWVRTRLDSLNVVGNGGVLLDQSYESWIMLSGSNVTDNTLSFESLKRLGRVFVSGNYWGDATREDLIEASSAKCGGRAAEEVFSFGLAGEPQIGAGPQHTNPWTQVCEHAVTPCS